MGNLEGILKKAPLCKPCWGKVGWE